MINQEREVPKKYSLRYTIKHKTNSDGIILVNISNEER